MIFSIKHILIPLILSLLHFKYCKNSEVHIESVPEIKPTIISFPNYNLNNVFSKNGIKIYKPYSVTFFDSIGLQIFRDIYLGDSIMISDTNKILNFHLVYNGIEIISYWLKKGNKYKISMENGIPNIYGNKNDGDSSTINFVNSLIPEMHNDLFSAYSLLTNPVGYLITSIHTDQPFQRYFKNADLYNKTRFLNEIKEDSIRISKNVIEQEYLNRYLDDVDFKKMKIQDSIVEISKWNNNNFYNLYFRTNFLESIRSTISSKNKLIIQSKIEKLLNDQSLISSKRDILLFLCLDNLTETMNDSILINKYKLYFSNTIYLNLINAKLKSYNENKNELVLIRFNDTILFSKLLTPNLRNNDNNTFKYVDFWASWCAPCRRAMPASAKLRSKYKGKKIEFIYLALNDQIAAWNTASKKEGLYDLPHNYFIYNSKAATLLEKLKIQTIPRYLIYDKKGLLINSNAPGPDDPSLIPLLDKLLE